MSNHSASKNDSIWGDLSAAFSKSSVSSQQIVDEEEQPVVQRIGTPRPKVIKQERKPLDTPHDGQEVEEVQKIKLNMEEEDI